VKDNEMNEWLIDIMAWLGLVGVPDPELIQHEPQGQVPEAVEADGIIIGNGRALDGAATTRDSTGVALAGVRVEHGRLVR
jgi:hypothetical protein